METALVADTSAINYLVLIDEVQCLETLFAKVIIPLAVERELSHIRTPAVVRAWVRNAPTWLDIRAVHSAHLSSELEILLLGPGEREAIALAEALAPSRLIVDDAEARAIAKRRGLATIGTVGVLREAAELGVLDLRSSLSNLRATGFRIADRLLQDVLSNTQ